MTCGFRAETLYLLAPSMG